MSSNVVKTTSVEKPGWTATMQIHDDGATLIFMAGAPLV